MPPGGIRTHDLSRREASDLRLRPRGYWDRHISRLLQAYPAIDQTDGMKHLKTACKSLPEGEHLYVQNISKAL